MTANGIDRASAASGSGVAVGGTGIVSLKDFGAFGDSTTNDSAAIILAEAQGKAIYVPNGTYVGTTIASTDLDGPYWGDGQIKDSGGYKRGKFFSAIKAAPSSLGSESGGVEQAFNGDWSKGQFPVEHRITGAATLGQPTSGYLYTPEAYPHYTYLYNESGHNNATASNTGRTAAVGYRTQVYQAGQGDAVAYNASVFVIGTKVGSTSFLANGAGVVVNGDLTAGVNGAFLNAGEFYLDDQAVYDAAGIGWVVNLDRSIVTGAKSVWWAGYRAQSVGSEEIDVAFSAIGPMNIGLDFTFATFPSSGTYNNAAITLKQNQRIYLNANGVDASGLSRFPSDPLDSYITYNSSLSAIVAVVGGSASLQVYSDHVGLDTGKYFSIGANQILSARDTGWTAFSGSASDKATAYDTATITLPQLAGRVRAMQVALTTHGLIGA